MSTIDRIKQSIGRTLTLLAALTFSSSALLVAACGTTEGVGKDIEAAGEGIQDMAN
ncbi:MAG: entericidin A/B family lipoprotein [Phycisphaerales bacterium]|nr:entericidin A/B family lipoprotein [Planctomycetota bacterium]MCH8507744.1 entericidin A/B family lipoprotein [Phycisphaerales bacterium]